MIGHVVPHRAFAAGYHCDPKQPLPFAASASQKNYVSLYVMWMYAFDGRENEHGQWFRAAWTQAGKRLDMGKCCVRFKKLDDLPLAVVGEAKRRQPARPRAGVRARPGGDRPRRRTRASRDEYGHRNQEGASQERRRSKP